MSEIIEALRTISLPAGDLPRDGDRRYVPIDDAIAAVERAAGVKESLTPRLGAEIDDCTKFLAEHPGATPYLRAAADLYRSTGISDTPGPGEIAGGS